MKIVSWNVNGIRAVAKKGFLGFFETYNPDILCIQETKAHPDQIPPELVHVPGWSSYFSSGRRKGYSGTATFLKKDVEQVSYGIGIRKFDLEGRFVVTHHKDFDVYNIYFPNGSAREERHLFKQEFLFKLNRHLERQLKSGREIIILGDYNVGYLDLDVYDPVRLSKSSGFLPEEREWFQDFLKLGFVDTYRHFYPDQEGAFTWWSYRENARLTNRGWRIDHICVSSGLLDKVTDVSILDETQGSDHCPIVMDINI